MKVLLTFTGFHDPYSLGLVGEEQQAGPVLSLMQAKSFDHLMLISTPSTQTNAVETRDILKELLPSLGISVIHAPLNDPTDYSAILRGNRSDPRVEMGAGQRS